MSPEPQSLIWTGPSEITRNLCTDYFIPANLQEKFGSLQNILSQVLTPERFQRLRTVASRRTRGVMPVFESTHHSHNISAVLRTADAFGFQDVGFVYQQTNMKFRINDNVERGASTWLLPRRTSSIQACAQALKSAGYKIFLVSLPTFARTSTFYQGNLPSFSAEQIGTPAFRSIVGEARIALISGNEKFGLSEEWVSYSDGYLHVTMAGFVESLNVSVCAGILLHALQTHWAAQIASHQLSPAEQNLLVEHWLARSCQNARQIVERENPLLLPWFEFVGAGKFYDPFA